VTGTTITRLEIVDEIVGRFGGPGVPGLAVGIYDNGDLVHTATAGYASVELGVPVTADTVFNIASVSKQFTAACILLLERDGKLSLDDEVQQHFPDFRLRPRVTLRQCAQHLAGLREYMSLYALVGADRSFGASEEAIMRVVSAQRDTNYEPGTEYAYSNTGYMVLAALVRTITGTSIGTFAHERIFVPLGMASTRFQEDVHAVVPLLANGYTKDDDGYHRHDSIDEAVGDGGLLTTVVDLARWAGFLADGRVLGVDVRDRLLTRGVLADGRVVPYALGIEHELVAGHRAIGHGGNIEGYHAHLTHLSDHGICVAVLTNRNDIDPDVVTRDIVAGLLGPGPDTGTATTSPSPPASDWSPAGIWYARELGAIYEMTLDDQGRIIVDAGHATIPFADDNGRWRPATVQADVWFTFDGDRARYSSGEDDWNPVWFDRIEVIDDAVDPAVAGTYASVELGGLTSITPTDDGFEIVIGGQGAQPLRLVQPDLFRVRTGSVLVERGADGSPAALLFSGGRMRRVRFHRLPEATTAVGFPLPLGGPVPDSPGS
jgi:CubicO group peptidase (beta-lactamase class C family)